VRRKRTRDKIGAPCKSSYGRTREGSQVDVSAQERGGEETGREGGREGGGRSGGRGEEGRRRKRQGDNGRRKEGQREREKTKLENTGERDGHPIDIRYRSGCIAFPCGRAGRADPHTVWFYLWLPKLQVAGRGGAAAM